MQIKNRSVNKDRKSDFFIYDLTILKACSLKEIKNPTFLEQLDWTILCTYSVNATVPHLRN